jgi:hypothetical protein
VQVNATKDPVTIDVAVGLSILYEEVRKTTSKERGGQLCTDGKERTYLISVSIYVMSFQNQKTVFPFCLITLTHP